MPLEILQQQQQLLVVHLLLQQLDYTEIAEILHLHWLELQIINLNLNDGYLLHG